MSVEIKSRFFITVSGYERMKNELLNLEKNVRPEIVKAIAEAKAFGDLSENAEYHAAKEKQRMTEKEIRKLRDLLSRAEQMDISNITSDYVQFGSRVKILDMQNNKEIIYQIVSFYEANLEQGLLSAESPIGLKLLNKKVDDMLEIKIPKGIKKYKVLEINF